MLYVVREALLVGFRKTKFTALLVGFRKTKFTATNNIRQMIIIIVGEPDVHGRGSQRSLEWQTSYLTAGLRSYLKQNVRYFFYQKTLLTTGLHILQLYTPVTHELV